jgi:hypothetical protein
MTWPQRNRSGKQSQSHITTYGHSVTLSWCQAPIWAPRSILLRLSLIIFDSYFFLWGVLSDERSGSVAPRVFVAAERIFFLKKGYTHWHTDWWKYAVEIGRRHDTHEPNFIQTGSAIERLIERAMASRKNKAISNFQNKNISAQVWNYDFQAAQPWDWICIKLHMISSEQFSTGITKTLFHIRLQCLPFTRCGSKRVERGAENTPSILRSRMGGALSRQQPQG